MSARTLLVCNRCGHETRLSPAQSTNATRIAAKATGWVYWRRGVDYCPACVPVVKGERHPLEYV